jgi:Cu+-exporting ATPase
MKEEKISFSVTGMTCAACARRVEKALSKTEGVLVASVNLATEKAAVEYDPSLVNVGELAGVVEGTGYGVVREEEEAPEGEYRALRGDFLLAAALTALILSGSL